MTEACRQCWADDMTWCAECDTEWCPTCENPCDCFDNEALEDDE